MNTKPIYFDWIFSQFLVVIHTHTKNDFLEQKINCAMMENATALKIDDEIKEKFTSEISGSCMLAPHEQRQQ